MKIILKKDEYVYISSSDRNKEHIIIRVGMNGKLKTKKVLNIR